MKNVYHLRLHNTKSLPNELWRAISKIQIAVIIAKQCEESSLGEARATDYSLTI